MPLSVDRPAGAARSHYIILPKYDDDLIGSLALELLLQTVEYLDPANFVRSQRAHINHSLILTTKLLLTEAFPGLEAMVHGILI